MTISAAGLRAGAATILGVVLLSVVGCSNDGEPESSPTTESTPVDEDAADKAALATLYGAYWTAIIQAEADLNADPAGLGEVMTPDAAQQYAEFIQQKVDFELFRSGEPVVSDDLTITVDGDAAVVEGCVDHTTWVVGSRSGTGIEQMFPPGPQPYVVWAERQGDGEWLISQTRFGDGARILCDDAGA